MIRSSSSRSSNWPMDRNQPPLDHRYYVPGGGAGGGARGDRRGDASDPWTRSSQLPYAEAVAAAAAPSPSGTREEDDRRQGEAAQPTGHLWHQEALEGAQPHAYLQVQHPPCPRDYRQHQEPSLTAGVASAAAAAAQTTTASSESDREASPFPPHHHHELAANVQMPFEDLVEAMDPVATTSMDSSSPDEDDDRKPAARSATDAKLMEDPRGSTSARIAGATSSTQREFRHSKRHSLSRDPFGGLSARLFPSDDPQELANPTGSDDDEVEVGVGAMSGPDASFDHSVHAPTFPHGGSDFYSSEGPLYDVHHSPTPSHSFAATPTSYAAHATTLHLPYGSPPPTTTFHLHHHQHHLAHTGSPVPPPLPVPPPRIYRFGHSAPPHYGPRLLPPGVGFVDSPPIGPMYMYSHTPQGPYDATAAHLRGSGGGALPAAARTEPMAKSRPAKKSQSRKAQRPSASKPGRGGPEGAGTASRRSSSGSGSGSSMGGGGREHGSSKTRRSTVHAGNSAAAVAAASSTTRSGERTSQVRHSPTDEEIAEAKTPRARAALTNWYKRLYDLIDYKNEHGDCNVPQKYAKNIALGVWVNKQRMEKKFMDEGKKTSMTPSKLRALEEVGFLWAKRKGQPSWDQRFSELVEYKSTHGDCNVPTKYGANPALGRWVSTQRSQYKLFKGGSKTQMTEDRMNRLRAIGFRWNMADSPLDDDDYHEEEEEEGDDDEHEYYGGSGGGRGHPPDSDDEYGGGDRGLGVGRRLFLSSGDGGREVGDEMEV